MPSAPASKNARTVGGSSHNHCANRHRYPTISLSHSLASFSDVSARLLESNANARCSLIICSRLCGSSSSSGSGSGAAAAGGGPPSAGTKKLPPLSCELLRCWGGKILLASALAREEKRTRSAKRRVARCVLVTAAMSNGDEVGGAIRAWRSGVTGGG